MSADNVEAVKKITAAFNERDTESLLTYLHPDSEMHEWPTGPGAQSYRGPDGVRQAFDNWFEVWEWMRIEIEELVAIDDRVLVTHYQRAKGKGSEVEVDIRSFSVYTFEDGKVTRLQLFTEREPALEAAGVTENDLAKKEAGR